MDIDLQPLLFILMVAAIGIASKIQQKNSDKDPEDLQDFTQQQQKSRERLEEVLKQTFSSEQSPPPKAEPFTQQQQPFPSTPQSKAPPPSPSSKSPHVAILASGPTRTRLQTLPRTPYPISQDLKKAILYKEILDKPLALRTPRL